MHIEKLIQHGAPSPNLTGFPPSAYIIGAQKSGTTFLASLLEQHPRVCVSEPKEPHYLSLRQHKGPDYYAQCFSAPEGKILVDASTSYSFLRERRFLDDPGHPGIDAPVPQRIKDLRPDAKLIYLLRDPAKRIESAFLHAYRDEDLNGQTLTLSEIVRRDPIFLVASQYSLQIERYLELFDIGDFLFLRFDDLTAQPQETVDRVTAFLGLPPVQIDTDTAERNERFKISRFGKFLATMRERLWKMGIPVNTLIPGQLRQMIRKGVFRSADEVTIVLDDEMRGILDAERAAVERLTGLTL